MPTFHINLVTAPLPRLYILIGYATLCGAIHYTPYSSFIIDMDNFPSHQINYLMATISNVNIFSNCPKQKKTDKNKIDHSVDTQAS